MKNRNEFCRDPRDAVIATPEEEASRDLSIAQNRAMGRIFLIFGGPALIGYFFGDEMTALVKWIVS